MPGPAYSPAHLLRKIAGYSSDALDNYQHREALHRIQKTVMMLFFSEELTYEEISTELLRCGIKISRRQVEKILHDARVLCRR